jgi:hypothetical protein
MEYLHMQMPKDGLWHNETMVGVPVKLTAIGSDGSVINIGTTTPNGYYGTFSQVWTSPTAGDYQVIAFSDSDDSYGSSVAATSISMVQMASATPAPTTTTNANDTAPVVSYVMVSLIVIVAAIAIVGALILRSIRKT